MSDDEWSGSGFPSTRSCSGSEFVGFPSDSDTAAAEPDGYNGLGHAGSPSSGPDDVAVATLVLKPRVELRDLCRGTSKDVYSVLVSSDMVVDCNDNLAANRAEQTQISQTQFSEHVFGPLPRAVAPIKAEARELGINTRNLKERTRATAMAIHCCLQLYWSAVIAWITAMKHKKQALCIARLRHQMQDETPAKLRGQSSSDRLRAETAITADEVSSWTLALRPGASIGRQLMHGDAGGNHTEVLKVLQIQLTDAFLLRMPGTGKYSLISAELPCRLVVWDSITGESLFVSMEEALPIPLSEAVGAEFWLDCLMTHWDRGAPCGLCHKIQSFVRVGKLTLDNGLCAAHCCHTVQGKGMDLVMSTISGLIALILTERGGGNWKKLRQALTATLKGSVIVRRAEAPPSNSVPFIRYRDRFFEQVLPDKKAFPLRALRQAILQTLC